MAPVRCRPTVWRGSASARRAGTDLAATSSLSRSATTRLTTIEVGFDDVSKTLMTGRSKYSKCCKWFAQTAWWTARTPNAAKTRSVSGANFVTLCLLP